MVGARTPASAPRRVAGRGRASGGAPGQTTGSAPEQPEVDAPAVEDAPAVVDPPADTSTSPPEGAPGLLARRHTTLVLSCVAGALGVAVVLLAALLLLPGDDAPGWTHEVGEAWEAPDTGDHPVTVGAAAWRDSVDAAATAVTDILSVDWQSYDEHREQVRGRMTASFAEEYEITAGDSRERFLASKAAYDFVVVGQSVVSAAEDGVTALLFLNEYVYKGEGDERTGPDVYQVRVQVTAVREGDAWLVDELDAL